MTAAPTRVFLADDNELILKMLNRLLSLEFEIVGRAVDGTTAVEAVLDAEPDVVVLDNMMPGTDGIETARSILARRPDLPIVLYTACLDGEVEQRAHDAGIFQCVAKVDGPLALERVIRRLTGELFLRDNNPLRAATASPKNHHLPSAPTMASTTRSARGRLGHRAMESRSKGWWGTW